MLTFSLSQRAKRSGRSPSSRAVNENEQGLSTSGNQEQEDDYDFWTRSYASDDDEIPTKQMSQDIMEEVSLTIDEAKLKKMVDEMLRQRCTSGDEHQYHIVRWKHFLKKVICGVKEEVNAYADHGCRNLEKNPHAKSYYTRKQKEPGKPKDVIYSNDKDSQVITDKDKDKYKDPPAGSDQGMKRRKTSKDVEPSKGSKSKESKSSSSKGTKSQPKSSGKSAQAEEESVFEVADTEVPQNQGSDLGNTDDQPNVEAASKHDCRIAQAEKSPLTFNELMSTPIEFLAYVMNNLKIDNLTLEHIVGTTFNLLKGTCRSQVQLEYHFEECYKVVNDRLDWNNPEGQEYPFDLSSLKPVMKIEVVQVVPIDLLH
ncbi:hypothetical protein Tco_0452419 [Tanacetum coccineum]